jgi:uncharacterized membrane protein YqjE
MWQVFARILLMGLVGVVLLVWPGSMAWEHCAGLIVFAIGALARVQWSFYKKLL